MMKNKSDEINKYSSKFNNIYLFNIIIIVQKGISFNVN